MFGERKQINMQAKVAHLFACEKQKALMEYRRLFDAGQRQHHLKDSCDSKMGTSDHHNPTGRKPPPLGDDPNLLHFLFLVKLFRLRKNHTFYIP